MSKAARIVWSVVVVAVAVASAVVLLWTRALFSTVTILVVSMSAFYTLRSMMDVRVWTLRTTFARFVALVGLVLALFGAVGYATSLGGDGAELKIMLPFVRVSEWVDVDQILNLSSILLAVSASMAATGDDACG